MGCEEPDCIVDCCREEHPPGGDFTCESNKLRICCNKTDSAGEILEHELIHALWCCKPPMEYSCNSRFCDEYRAYWNADCKGSISQKDCAKKGAIRSICKYDKKEQCCVEAPKIDPMVCPPPEIP
jgi:hypothetical protein